MTSRRAILAAPAFFAGVAAASSACQVYGGPEQEPGPAAPAAPGAAPGNAPGNAPGAAPGSATGNAPGAGAGSLARLADIPVGGGRIFAPEKVVVTQPEAGVVKAFSAICTHQGCAVTQVAGGTIKCACHGSAFRITDGSVAAGPATRPLPAAAVTLDGDTIKLA